MQKLSKIGIFLHRYTKLHMDFAKKNSRTPSK